MKLIDLDKLDKNAMIMKASDGEWYEYYDGLAVKVDFLNIIEEGFINYAYKMQKLIKGDKELTEDQKLGLGMC